jgi:hypothetical protein
MASLHKDIFIAASPAEIWSAARDIGALHTRLVPGFVVDTKVEGDARIVTFGNGMVVREPILSVDDERRRLAWTAEGAGMTHYNAVLTWTSDLLPHSMAEQVGAMQDQGLAVMKRTLEASAAGPSPV